MEQDFARPQRTGMGQDKTMRGEDEDPILQPAPPSPIAIPNRDKSK